MRTGKKTAASLAIACVAALAGAAHAEPAVRSAYDFIRQGGYVDFRVQWQGERPGRRAPDHELGDTRSFWSWDLGQMPPRDVQVPATCRAVGDHVYVFVADDQWGANVDQAGVDAVFAALELATPAGSIDPEQGIVPNEIGVFGPVPDALDGDVHVFILLMELDQYGGTQFDGFFNPFNQYPDEETMAQQGYHSNEIEMITVNSAIRPVGSAMTLSILAHELQHLIHWGGDPEEASWVDESCAEAAMVLCGYPQTDQAWLDDYLADPSAALEETAHVHYGACLLFGSYLYERFGAGFMGELVADPAHGRAGFAGPLARAGQETMDSLLLDWATATLGDHLGLEGELAHPLLEVGAPRFAHRIDAYPSELQASLTGTGAAYARLARPDPGADVQLQVDGARVQARALLAGEARVWYADCEDGVPLQLPFAEIPDAPEGYVVLLADQGAAASYTLAVESVSVEPDGGPDGGEDGGVEDGGGDSAPDAGGADQGVETDAGTTDAGTTDAGSQADGDRPEDGDGCGCASSGAHADLALALLGLLAALARRR
ncbi:MAG: hypothetical protein JXR96_11995 [Deltaproteobacteria bacterium]|nr:hypothetical protein [Deltaproteobacteria bacterium]